MSQQHLAFAVMLECVRLRDWSLARALVDTLDEEIIDMCTCRPNPLGATLCNPPTVAEYNMQLRANAELERQLDAAQALLLRPARPPHLVERLVAAVAAWKADRVLKDPIPDGPEGDLYDAYQALEDADIFSGSPAGPEPLPREEPEDDIPPSYRPPAPGEDMTEAQREEHLRDLRETHGKTDAEVIRLAEANQWPLDPGADHHAWLILLGRGDLINDSCHDAQRGPRSSSR